MIALVDFASRPLYFFATPLSRVHLGLSKGSLRLVYQQGLRVDDWGIEINGGEPPRWWFRVDRLRVSSIDLTLPLWPFMTGSLAAAVWGWGVRRRERRAAPFCTRCGYDLTGATGVCPECGRPRPGLPGGARP